ncbi:sulfotransferase family protein [Desulfotignum balticum]|jgi:hypothetical protein|uniref:sulfotransferase family protein n=1 Tax=Desulfotignum balticum TaxID=115781 RepID=UPI00041535DF|nr:sulfotransferase [Desulfotignum balticum]
MVVSLQKLFLNVKNRYIQNKRKENWRDKIQDQMNCSYNDEICKQRIENYPIPLKNEYPCFIFAASWRTGSTLIQRLINASGEIYIWGEPTFLPQLSDLYHKTTNQFKKVAWNRKAGLSDNVGNWIPVVSPSDARVRDAVGAFLTTLYQEESLQKGCARWGFKEVRPNALNHIKLLSEAYPRAKFIFLVRDPYDTYRSIKGKKFHAKFSDPYGPIRVWKKNVQNFLDTSILKTKTKLVRYEELCKITRDNDSLLSEIASHFDIQVTEKMYNELESKVDSTGKYQQLSSSEIDKITYIVGETGASIGYRVAHK